MDLWADYRKDIYGTKRPHSFVVVGTGYTIPILANIAKASTCHIEIKKTKR
jgi:hypothetical protein